VRVVSNSAATAAVQVVADEVMPTRGILHRDLIEFVGGQYHFQGKPPIPPGLGLVPVMQFQSGVAMIDGERIPIQTLIIFRDGHAVVAADTDLATAVLDDFLKNLDEGLGYRFHEVEARRVFSSALVVEFDPKFVERAAIFDVIQTAAKEATYQPSMRYHLKRISFGTGAEQEEALTTQFLSPDFSIDRRAGVPLEKNIFFSIAPLTTKAHAAYLERIERDIIALG